MTCITLRARCQFVQHAYKKKKNKLYSVGKLYIYIYKLFTRYPIVVVIGIHLCIECVRDDGSHSTYPSAECLAFDHRVGSFHRKERTDEKESSNFFECFARAL